MKIKKIISQNRRDFTAIYECENCGHTYESSGYDDENFHKNIIPNFKCPKCGSIAGDNYVAKSTKYHQDEVI